MNSMPFRQLKSFLKILIGVQYEVGTGHFREMECTKTDTERKIPMRALPFPMGEVPLEGSGGGHVGPTGLLARSYFPFGAHDCTAPYKAFP